MRAEEFLLEALGNLEQLHLGPFVKMLKQQVYYGRRSNNEGPVSGNKFVNTRNAITSTSEIVDVPKFACTLSEIKKIYSSRKKNEEYGKGFAVYINDAIVGFFLIDSDQIGKTSNGVGLVGYDLSMFEKELRAKHDEEQSTKSWGKSNFNLNDYKNSESKKTYDDTELFYQGRLMSVIAAQQTLDKIKKTAELVNGTVTAKVVFADVAAQKKRINRSKIRNMPGHETKEELLKDLNLRLQKYKLSKKPTANSIEEFIEMTISHSGKFIQFAGKSYHMVKHEGSGNSVYISPPKGSPPSARGTYKTIMPLDIMNGTPFSIEYKAVKPGSTSGKFDYDYSDKVEIFYIFDIDDGKLHATHAVWPRPGTDYKKTVGVLNPVAYVKGKLKGKPFNEQNTLDILNNLKKTDLDNAINISKSILDAGYKWSEIRAFYKQAVWDQMIKNTTPE
jgi:hypothetical protein